MQTRDFSNCVFTAFILSIINPVLFSRLHLVLQKSSEVRLRPVLLPSGRTEMNSSRSTTSELCATCHYEIQDSQTIRMRHPGGEGLLHFRLCSLSTVS